MDWRLSPLIRDPHCRWPIKRTAVGIHRRPENHGIAAGTGPRNVATAAVTKADHVPDKDLIRAEAVPVGAAGRWMRDPLPGRGLNQLAQHK
jgi:hypothetical protein